MYIYLNIYNDYLNINYIMYKNPSNKFQPKSDKWEELRKLKNKKASTVSSLKFKSPQQVDISKTSLGRKVLNNEVSDLKNLLKEGYLRDPNIIDYLLKDELKCKILHTDKVCHTLRAGKVYQFRVVAGVGDCKGSIGVGVGKSKHKNIAIKKAINNAKKEMIYLEGEKKDYRYEDTVKGEIYNGPIRQTEAKRGKTVIKVSPLQTNTVTASKNGKLYCSLGNLTNIKIGLASKNKATSKLNYFTALHEALKKQV